MMSALDRKLLRDLWLMRGQALAICLVMACGVATFVMSLSLLHSLETTQQRYYEDYRFAHVFAHVKRRRAPCWNGWRKSPASVKHRHASLRT